MLAAIKAVAAALPEAVIDAGALLDPADFSRARDAGAAFAVSPGLDMDLVGRADAERIDNPPGIQTSSEAMAAWRIGIRRLTFFPVKAAGGVHALRQLAPLYPGLRFCPAGGIGFGDAPAYLTEPNVACVGGGFVAPQALANAGDRAAVAALARRAAALRDQNCAGRDPPHASLRLAACSASRHRRSRAGGRVSAPVPAAAPAGAAKRPGSSALVARCRPGSRSETPHRSRGVDDALRVPSDNPFGAVRSRMRDRPPSMPASRPRPRCRRCLRRAGRRARPGLSRASRQNAPFAGFPGAFGIPQETYPALTPAS